MSILLADRLLGGMDVVNMAEWPFAKWAMKPSFLTYLKQSVVFEATNVSDYWWQTKKASDMGAHELTNVMPPFDLMWVEVSNANIPHESRIMPYRSGIHIDKHPATSLSEFDKFSRNSFGTAFKHIRETDDWVNGHLLTFTVFQAIRFGDQKHLHQIGIKGDFALVLGCAFMGILPNGQPFTGLHFAPNMKSIQNNYAPKDQENAYRQVGETVANEIYSALFAVQFSHCKNVKTALTTPDTKLSKAHERRTGNPLVQFRTIEIEPMKQVLETEGGIGHNGLKKALHICRGHFATYTPEKGMMGRKLQEPVTVWKPAHVRGNKEFGEVKKDYRIKI